MILTARYVVPVTTPPIEQGAVTIADGRVQSVGETVDLVPPGHEVVDFGDAVITPGFVNAHTHLELSHLAGQCDPKQGFTAWLRNLVTLLSEHHGSREAIENAVSDGILKSLSAGVTAAGDITRYPVWTRPILAGSPLRTVSFGEVIAIGRNRDRADRLILAALDRQHENKTLRCAISPHAPYTVDSAVLQQCAEAAAQQNARICIHLAETPEEAVFTCDATGAFAELLRLAGLWDDSIRPQGASPVQLADQAGLLGPTTLVAHANYVNDEDIDMLVHRGASVAYCPRTHDAFAHAPHRFTDMQEAGLNVCLATDSLASNPSLSPLDELRYVRARHPDLPPYALLEMITSRPARALGLESCAGTIAPGRPADLVVLPLPPAGTSWDACLEDESGPLAVYVGGAPVHARHADGP